MRAEQGRMPIRLRPLRTSTISFGGVYLCPLEQNEISAPCKQPRLIVVLHATSLCENATAVYGAPLSCCDEDGLFKFRVGGIDNDGAMSGAVIDLSKIAVIPVSELHVKTGQLGRNDIRRLGYAIGEIFGLQR